MLFLISYSIMKDYDMPHSPSQGYHDASPSDDGHLLISQRGGSFDDVDFEEPRISSLPRVLMMGSRRAGKTSIQVRVSRDLRCGDDPLFLDHPLTLNFSPSLLACCVSKDESS